MARAVICYCLRTINAANTCKHEEESRLAANEDTPLNPERLKRAWLVYPTS